METSHRDRSYNPMTTMIWAEAAFWMEYDKELISKHRFVLVKTRKLELALRKSVECFEHEYTFFIALKKLGQEMF